MLRDPEGDTDMAFGSVFQCVANDVDTCRCKIKALAMSRTRGEATEASEVRVSIVFHAALRAFD